MKKYTFLLLIILLLAINRSYSQQCYTNWNPNDGGNSPSSFLLNASCNDINLYNTLNNNTQTKIIRIAFHVFQKAMVLETCKTQQLTDNGCKRIIGFT